MGIKKRMLCLALAVCLGVGCGAAGLAEAAGGEEQAFGDEAAWARLMEVDEAFREGTVYTPILRMDVNGDIETWLVGFRSDADTPEEQQYLVMYIQLTPSPKVIGTALVGEPLEELPPACEIKLLLDAEKALGEDPLPTDSLREQLRLEEETRIISVVYLETPDRAFLESGWINRLRVKPEKARYELTYKIRYPVENNDLDAALAAARADGFSLYDSQFQAEVDWGYEGMTLSFSTDVNVKTETQPDMALLALGDAIGMIAGHMPSEERDWLQPGWGAETASAARMTAPVSFQRYYGTLGDQSVTLEVWPMLDGDETRYLVELSTKCESVEEASPIRDRLLETLDALGILLHSDAQKTRLMLDGLRAD